MALELRVTRHPFSFLSDLEGAARDRLQLKAEGTWHERLLDYTHGDEHLRDQAMAGMIMAGRPHGIEFDYNVYINRQPVDSQRVLLYAARRGKQEEYVSALSKRHFTQGSQGESASKRHTILAAAAEAGLDQENVAAFLETDELRDVVWRSYGDMPRRGIGAIPFFVFNVPELGLEGGPLRPQRAGSPPTVNGSMQVQTFTDIFESLWSRVVKQRKARALEMRPPSATTDERMPRTPPSAPTPPNAALRADGGDALVGVEVVLHGLQSRPELNGARGQCKRYDVRQGVGRYAVRLAGSHETLLVKPANMRRADGTADGGVIQPEGRAPSAPTVDDDICMI